MTSLERSVRADGCSLALARSLVAGDFATHATVSTRSFLKASRLSTSDVILQQIISDFEDLAQLTQRAIDARERDDEQTKALRKVRDAAFRGAALARKVLSSNQSS